MNESENSLEGIDTQHGLVGFFDVLGYQKINENSQIKEAVLVVRRILETTRKSQKANDFVGTLVDQTFCEHVVFSDSILVYSSFKKSRDQATSAAMFASYCSGLITELFWAGLPVRGALALGDYYVENHMGSVCFAGRPIIEAHELADCLDLAACVVAPSAEEMFSTDPGFFEYLVPLKGQKQKMIMLNHYASSWAERELSREVMMKMFGAHNKHVGIEVLSKVNNTLEFLRECRSNAARLAGKTDVKQ